MSSAVIKDAWENMNPGPLANLIATMFWRCQANIDAGGGVTKY